MARTDGDARARRRNRLKRFLAFVVLASLGTPGDGLADEDADADIGIADAVYVDKSERRLDLLRDGAVIATFDIALDFEPGGHKTEEGDGRRPDGTPITIVP
jgi:hypothetical protein